MASETNYKLYIYQNNLFSEELKKKYRDYRTVLAGLRTNYIYTVLLVVPLTVLYTGVFRSDIQMRKFVTGIYLQGLSIWSPIIVLFANFRLLREHVKPYIRENFLH